MYTIKKDKLPKKYNLRVGYLMVANYLLVARITYLITYWLFLTYSKIYF